MTAPFEIWDGHCHLSGVPGSTPEVRFKELLRFADRMGIQRLCLSMGMEWQYDPSPDQVHTANDEVTRVIRAFPDRAFGFVYLNPKHRQASIDELNRCIRDGPMVGVKLWVAQRCHEPELDPLIARAAELNAVVLQHTWIKITGNLPGESTPSDLVQLAQRHPKASFICGHTGGDWEAGIQTIRSCTNIHADLAGGDPTSGFTEMAVRELGVERVIYGSDAGGRSFASQLAKVYGAEIAEKSKRLILSKNLQRLLTPILRSKGIQK